MTYPPDCWNAKSSPVRLVPRRMVKVSPTPAPAVCGTDTDVIGIRGNHRLFYADAPALLPPFHRQLQPGERAQPPHPFNVDGRAIGTLPQQHLMQPAIAEPRIAAGQLFEVLDHIMLLAATLIVLPASGETQEPAGTPARDAASFQKGGRFPACRRGAYFF